jgi:hypothetical protein
MTQEPVVPAPKARASNPEPPLKPDGRIRRVADLTERKLQLEVELLELQVTKAKTDLYERGFNIDCESCMRELDAAG